MRALTVPPGSEPMRLDVFLTAQLPHCSRRAAQRAIAAGAVRVNGRRVRKGASVVAGDVVDTAAVMDAPPRLQANPQLAVGVLYEDAAVIAIDKPAGMPAHALRHDEMDTAANFLLARYPELATVGAGGLQPGIVHRLDTDTSGILLAARSLDAYRALRRQFAAHRVDKEYLAIVHGDVPRAGELQTPIAHDRRNRRRMRVAPVSARRARHAVTCYHPVERFGSHTLLRVRIRTGVRHQVRVHLASIGHPVSGDRLYGTPALPATPARHLLHACRVGFAHPQTGAGVQIDSVPPADFTDFLGALRGKTQRASAGTTRKARR